MATVPTSPYLKIEVVNGKAVIFSLHVACHFKRMHQNIVDKIEYLNCSREFLPAISYRVLITSTVTPAWLLHHP